MIDELDCFVDEVMSFGDGVYCSGVRVFGVVKVLIVVMIDMNLERVGV